MNKTILIMISLILNNFLIANCNGFNWYHNIEISECNPNDIAVLEQFILNSKNSLEMDMDTNLNGKIEPLELGWQLWEEGRLIHWICQEVPSPYYFYEYDCGLSGNIPNEIDNLDAIIKLRLQKNNLTGKVPKSICNLKVTHSGNYWFNLNDNHLCPPYPDCIDKSLNTQNITNCK